MTVTIRSYRGKRDYQLISDFLVEIYRVGEKPGNWLQPRWEYMHSHPLLDEGQLGKIGIWEEDGRVVGAAHYESVPGEAFFQVRPGYSHLKEEMLSYAEEHLCHQRDSGRKYLRAHINDFDREFEDIALARGYRKKEDEPLAKSAFQVPSPFPQLTVPAGFKLLSLADENDLAKVDRVLHRGFDHPGEPPADGIEGRRKMQSAPNFRKDLTIIVKSPEGAYAAFCGMWFEPAGKFAYVEPVATDPDYRRLGLGRAAVLEGIRRCGELGATIAYVGSGQDFYKSFGFRELFSRYAWTNVFNGH